MTLSPEQFSQMATKRDLYDLRDEILVEFKGNFSDVFSVLDGIIKRFDDHDKEHVANIAAHDRFEGRISKLEAQI